MGPVGHHRELAQHDDWEMLRRDDTVNRTVPVLPLPSEPYRSQQNWYNDEHAGEERGLQRHRSNVGEESRGYQSRQRDDHRQAGSLPEWIKPLPFSRLPRGLCHQRIGAGTTATRLDSQVQSQERFDLRPISARGVEPPLHTQTLEEDRGGHVQSQGEVRRSWSSHYDQQMSGPSRKELPDEPSHDRRLSSERIPVSQRRF